DWWWRSSTGWFNVSTFAYYNNSGAAKFTSAYLNASDAIKFNEWQTLEEYAQMSSAPLVADGITKIWRNGTNILSKTDHVTHDAGSGVWRYLLLGQAIESTQPVFGTPDFDIYYDDIYIDNTQSRVMICDASSWSTRTQCEVQIPVTWADNSITFTLNTGRFTLGQVVYIYVIDSNGVANTAGYNCKLGAPLPPKNFIKVP
ncbi:MAG: hypothetical protein WCL71_15295, partial [Deltaproteobacteria bacterium]